MRKYEQKYEECYIICVPTLVDFIMLVKQREKDTKMVWIKAETELPRVLEMMKEDFKKFYLINQNGKCEPITS